MSFAKTIFFSTGGGGMGAIKDEGMVQIDGWLGPFNSGGGEMVPIIIIAVIRTVPCVLSTAQAKRGQVFA